MNLLLFEVVHCLSPSQKAQLLHKDQGKGSGIGLFLSKTIVETKMGGGLTARNVEGCAEFRIEI
jgi:signal transduction histidine kinase